MGFISKVELKKQLQILGVKVEGNYVKKKNIEKALGASKDAEVSKAIDVYRVEDKDGVGPFRSKLSPRGQWIGSPTLRTNNEFSEEDVKNLIQISTFLALFLKKTPRTILKTLITPMQKGIGKVY